jgi:hypothetical protein
VTSTGEKLRVLLLQHDIKPTLEGKTIVLRGRVHLLAAETKRSLRAMKVDLVEAIQARVCRCPVCGRGVTGLDLT